MRLKSKEEIEILREAGKVLAGILDELENAAKDGVSTKDLDDKAMQLVERYGAEPVLLGYHPTFAGRPYPAAICTSVNNVVQHGIPKEEDVLKEGDLLNLDVTIGFKGMIVDSGRTFGIGKIDEVGQKLIDVTREARALAIKAAVPGGRIGDIGAAVEAFVKPTGFSIVEALCGHGVGYAVHEEPMVPNFGRAGTGEEIVPGLVLAIEPILNEGKKDVWFDDDGDGYSVYTEDGKRSAHFEHTVAITENGPEIMTTN